MTMVERAAAILLAHDPGMVDYGLNPDEYVVEATAIVARLAKASSWEDARAITVEVLEESLGPEEEIRRGSYEAAAADLWRLIRGKGGD